MFDKSAMKSRFRDMMAKRMADRGGAEMSGRPDMPRMGMMGGRGMAEAIAQRAGAMGPQGAGGAANATSIGERANVQKKAKGGKVKKMAKGGSTASKRADGCASKGKTKGRFV